MANILHHDAESRRSLANQYHDLNGTHIEILDQPPSALEFSRLVHISRPVIIKGFQLPASTLWSNEYLVDRMGQRMVSVAVTPNGRADAVTKGPDGRLYFTEPYIEQMSMSELLSRITINPQNSDSEVHYLQSQNGNMYSAQFFENNGAKAGSEFESLRQDVSSEISWCSEAFDRKPDAVNLWIGNGRSVTSIHSDPYENIYTVIRGKKHFTLLPPTEGWCLEERTYPHATYTRPSPGANLELTPSPSDVAPIRWSSIANPHLPDVLPPEAHPLHITLSPGDTLYLPVGWWHHVQQSEEVTIALNWWYDAEMRGMSWVSLSFLRGIEDVPPGNIDTHMGGEDHGL